MVFLKRQIVIFADAIGSEVLLRSLERVESVQVVAVVVTHDLEKVQKFVQGDVVFLQHASNSSKDLTILKRELMHLQPHLGICFSYDRKIPRDVFTIPVHGTLNLHGGKLPEYRGANVLNWVLINGEDETQMTLHVMSDQIDEGPIIDSANVSISQFDTAVDLRKKLIETVPGLIEKNIEDFLDGNIQEQTQRLGQISKYRRRLPEDGFVDLNWPALTIYNLNRALVDPWPGIFWFDKQGNKHSNNSFLSLEQVKEIKRKYS